ncbi:MAG TPA: Asp-tRNA(Asn)/Glu-tRNA(Gln) amidotransferase subunit GatA [Planctomycetota bacterium]|nr:Asp-tRNA(Asn)/Glu-tRNA(Gln) amidotransferase subunit GatA [Planctomycetota bacterium]
MTALWQMPAAAIAAAVRAGHLTAREVVTACLDRVHRVDRGLNAMLGNRSDAALAAARALDEERQRGQALGSLAGVPIAWKDNLVLEGELATAGSRMLEGFRSPYSATVLSRLQRAGAILIGRTNMDEFGMGSSTETSAYGPTRNPFGPDLVPGGSSGGSAVAVAADFCPLALGSDTGGSVRQPAAMCGVSGLKPTYGRVSRYGLIAYASSLDCVGALARTAEDLALWLDATAGADPADPTTVPAQAPVTPHLANRRDLAGLRIGLPAELNGPGLDPEVASAIERAVSQLRELGAQIVECTLPAVAHAVPTYYLLATAEASSNLARYDGVRYGLRRDAVSRCEPMMMQSRSAGFGDEVQLRILLGTFALSFGYHDQYYGQATRARALLCSEFARAFASCELLLSPTSPVPAFPLGSRIDDPLAMYLCDVLTVPASLAGLPALSQPCGFTADGRPIGMQWVAPALREDLLLQVAHVFQAHTDHHLRRPVP